MTRSHATAPARARRMRGLQRLCRNLETALGRAELCTLLLAFTAMLALSLADIVGRNFFNATLPGGDTLLRLLVLWVALPGAALAVARQRHLHLDPANLAARPRWQAVAAPLFNLTAALVCALLDRAAWAYWLDAQQHAPPGAAWQVWMEIILPISFALLALHFLLRAALTFRGNEA